MSQQPNQDMTYDSQCIESLSLLESVRKRPGMYIGHTDDGTGLHNLVLELFKHVLLHAQGGREASVVTLVIEGDRRCFVEADGPGLSVEIVPELEIPLAQAMLTMPSWHYDSEKRPSSMHYSFQCIGLAAVSALCSRLELETWHAGQRYKQRYAYGEPVTKLTSYGETQRSGTRFVLEADEAIFHDPRNVLDYGHLTQAFAELAMFYPGARLQLLDRRSMQSREFLYPRGAVDFLLDQSPQRLHPEEPFSTTLSSEDGEATIQLALAWNLSCGAPDVMGFTNGRLNEDGGTHIQGVFAAVREVFHPEKSELPIVLERPLHGLVGMVSVSMRHPRLSGSTWARLNSLEIRELIQDELPGILAPWLAERPRLLRLLQIAR